MIHQILHVLGTAQPESTGMARIVEQLARGLDSRRFRIHAAFLAGDGPLVTALEQAGVRTRALDWGRGVRDPVGAWRFWRLLRSQRIDVVQVHFGGRSVCRLARAGSGARVVRHAHGRILESRGLSPVRISARGADIVVAVSRAVARQVVDGPARVIYAGVAVPPVDPPAPRRREAGELVLGTAGRIVELKGLADLLQAAAALRSEFPGLRLEIAGSGPQRADLERTIARLGLGDRVAFLGWVRDLPPTLAGWDAFVLPSLEEGFPIAALDAMAAGLPVVATAVGGVPELIEDGRTGWLVTPGDAEALAARLRLVLSDPASRARVGTAGRTRVRDHFGAARMTEAFAGLYEELLGG
jgi:glycosyltransferase involved in cell wall biosynthesis